MADNFETNAATGGVTFASDDVAGVHYPISKLAFGALDAAVLAIAGAGNVTTGTQRVTLAADDPAVVDLAAIEVLLTTIAGDTTDIEAALETAGGLVVNLAANNDVTVTGTVDLGATDNAVLDAIAASVAASDTDLTTIIGHVDGIEALLGTIDADTSGIITAVQLIDDVVYVDDADWTDDTSKHVLVGGLFQSTPQTVTDGDVAPFQINANGVLLVAQSGTWDEIGINDSGNSITVDNAGLTELAAAINASSQMDVNIAAIAGSLTLGTVTTVGTVSALGVGTTGPQKAEDVASAAGDMGIAVMAVRDDTLDARSTTEGDYEFFHTNANGALWVLDVNSAAAATSLALIDDIIYTDDTSTHATGTSKGALIMGVAVPTDTAISANDIGAVAMTVNRGLHTSIQEIPRSMQGPAQPGTAIDSYTHAAFNLAAGNDQVLVASAASKQIWVYGIGFTTNVAGTVSFQDEDNTAITGIMNIAANSGMAIAPSGNFSMPIWKLATDKDLEVDVVTAELDGWVDYAILSV